MKGYYEVLWETGLRPGTVDSLSVPEHYEKGSKTLHITEDIDKSRYERDIPLTERARTTLDRVCPPSGLIFGHRQRLRQFKQAADKAGMPPHFAPYDLRHQRVTHLLEASGDNLLGVGYLVGHKRTTTTDGYLHKNRRQANDVMEALERRKRTERA